MKRAFTLIEVTLAMGIMAVGIMAIVGLYSFGYRESAQSREDVGATAVADAVLGQLTMAISATNLKWSVFRALPDYPSEEGWGFFIDSNSGRVTTDPTSRAKSDFSSFMSRLSGGMAGRSSGLDTAFPQAALDSTGLGCGLLIQHEKGSSVVRIAFRAMRRRQELLSAPLFYTEVKFQGVDD